MSVTTYPDTGSPVPGAVDVRRLTLPELQQLGMAHLAYVKPVRMDGETTYAIFVADGTALATAADCNHALALILQHEMTPALVH